MIPVEHIDLEQLKMFLVFAFKVLIKVTSAICILAQEVELKSVYVLLFINARF